jgi:hypothetical protein
MQIEVVHSLSLLAEKMKCSIQPLSYLKFILRMSFSDGVVIEIPVEV